VNHRQLEVRVRVVDRLAPGFGDGDEGESDCAERQCRAPPDVRACRRRDDAPQIRRAGNERRDGDREHERRVDEDGERQVAARTHQREAAADVPGGCGDDESRQGEHADERERVVAESPTRRGLGCRNDEDGEDKCRGRDRRREPVHHRRSFRRDRALSPKTAQLAIRLQRARTAPTLKARLSLLHETGQKRCQSDTA
jgi:hypothetical protein